MLSGTRDFDVEWRDAQQLVLSRCTAALSDLGMSKQGLRYVMNMKGYPRIPYFTALWVTDAVRRKEIGIAVCIHAIGIKLLDDLLDKDQPISQWDQILGVFLLQMSTSAVGRYDFPREILDTFEADYRIIWRKQLDEMHSPPNSMESWTAYARVKSGLMLANYAAVACLAGGAKESVDTARAFSEAFGVLFMIGDDLRDYKELHETEGNLGHLVVTRQISVQQILTTIQHWHSRAREALQSRPVPYDVTAFLDEFAGTIVTKILQLPISVA